MCVTPAGMIADKALAAAQAQWDLVSAINAEARVHSGVVAGARALLVERLDLLALQIFDAVAGTAKRQGPDLEKARALVEGAGAEREEVGGVDG